MCCVVTLVTSLLFREVWTLSIDVSCVFQLAGIVVGELYVVPLKNKLGLMKTESAETNHNMATLYGV